MSKPQLIGGPFDGTIWNSPKEPVIYMQAVHPDDMAEYGAEPKPAARLIDHRYELGADGNYHHTGHECEEAGE